MDSEGDATGALRELSAKGHGCFRPQGLFHELGGGGCLRETEAQELWQVQKQISAFVLLLDLGAEGNQNARLMRTFHRLQLVSCLPRGGNTGSIISPRPADADAAPPPLCGVIF